MVDNDDGSQATVLQGECKAKKYLFHFADNEIATE